MDRASRPIVTGTSASGSSRPGLPMVFFPVNHPYYALEASDRPEVKNSNLWNKDLNNFGPRVGFAWDVRGTGKLVVRAGGGIFYDRLYNNVFENIRFNAPFYADETAGS